MLSNWKWGELVSNSSGIEVNNRTFQPRGPSSTVTLKYYRVKHFSTVFGDVLHSVVLQCNS